MSDVILASKAYVDAHNGSGTGEGIPGPAGPAGADGKSAYEIWLELGYAGTEQDFINSLKGPEGTPGLQGPQGPAGEPGSTSWEDINGKPNNLAGFGLLEEVQTLLQALKIPITVYFSGNGSLTLPIGRGATYTTPIDHGTGSLVYEVSQAETPEAFSVVNFPITPLVLTAGDRLRITCSGIVSERSVTLT